MLKYLILLLPLFLASCQKEEEATYLHIAHTRSYDGSKDKLMLEVEQIDYEKYDVLMLGGDMVFESTGKKETLLHLDNVFDLSNPTVLWTLGNHDYHQHPEWIPEITKRPTSYVFHKNRITFLVLDSQENHCNTTGTQKELFDKTLSALPWRTTHLIVLHHKLIWMMDGGELEKNVNSISNGGSGNCFHCVMPNDFYSSVYPQLVEVQKKGVQVICIAGDIGAKTSKYKHQTKEGIYFLASGLKDKGGSNKGLLFKHNLAKGELNWEFEPLENLPKK